MENDSSILIRECLHIIFLSMFTVLNMLIGVLCEVVSALSARSKEETLIDNVRETLLGLLQEFDKDGNHTIGKSEFGRFCDTPACVRRDRSRGLSKFLLRRRHFSCAFTTSSYSIFHVSCIF